MGRLDLLERQWRAFAAEGSARVLRWLARDDEWTMLDTFVLLHQRCPPDPADRFLRLSSGFGDVNSYGAALRDELIQAVAADGRGHERDAGRDETHEAPWTPPPLGGRHSLLAFVEACASLRAQWGPQAVHLAVVLTPAAVADEGEWQRWLVAAAAALPPGVRLVVFDSVESPSLEPLAAALPCRLVTLHAALDMPGAMLEIARAGDGDTPGGAFRVHFAGLCQAAGAGDLAGADSAGRAALAIASREGWSHLSAGVQLALGSALLSAGRFDDAIAHFQEADAIAAGAVAPLVGASAEEGGADSLADSATFAALRMHAAFATGAAWVAAGRHDAGALIYEQAAATRAQAAGEPLMLLEAWRMAGYCHERAGDPLRAWECGWRALSAAESVDSEVRKSATLPYVAEMLLRLAGSSYPHVEAVQQRMDALLGTGPARAEARP